MQIVEASADLTIAPQLARNDACVHHTAGVTRMVFGQLFPHGQFRYATCSELWRQSGDGMDEWIDGGALYNTYLDAAAFCMPSMKLTLHRNARPAQGQLETWESLEVERDSG